MLSKILYEIRELKQNLENSPKRYCINDILDRLNDLEDLTNEIIDEME